MDTTEGISFAPVLENPSLKHRDYAFGEDHWHDYEDHARCVVTRKFKLIRNDYVDLPATPSADAGRGLSWQKMLEMDRANKLSRRTTHLLRCPTTSMGIVRIWRRDPGELDNRIDDAAYRSVKKRLKRALTEWSERTGDYLPSRRTPDEFDRVSGEPDHSVRIRPRPVEIENVRDQRFLTNYTLQETCLIDMVRTTDSPVL